MMRVDDSEWLELLDEEKLTERRARAEIQYRDLGGEQISYLRRRAKRDLFFLASGLLGYDRLSTTFHGHYAAWLREVQGQRYRMTLFARDHYKSTINTISDSIQMALPPVGDEAHPYSLGPNVKILLLHEVRESASRFLFNITSAFRAKPLMLALFPDLIPSPRVQRMNKFELELPRSDGDKEPTFDTLGAGGAAQGRHHHWLKMDDIMGEEARDSETVMARLLTWFDNTAALLERLKIDGWDLVGTRWSMTDVYAHATKSYGVNKKLSILNAYDERDIEAMEEGELVIYARGAMEDGVPVFPEEFAPADLARIRKNPIIWASQYANNPRDTGLSQLDPKWLRFYHHGKGDRIIVFDGDGTRSVRTSDLDIVILVDPAVGEKKTSDEWGFVVTGTDERMNIYLLEAYRKRLKPPEGIDEMFALYMKWNPRLISIESVAFSAMLKYWFDETCRRMRVYPHIHDYKPGSNRSKIARIKGLANYAAGGQLFILEGMHEFRDEWEWFPMSDVDHLLDALAQGPEVWAPPVKQNMKDADTAAEAVFAQHRDALTGY